MTSTATAYTRERTRPWPYGGDNKESATEEFYILDAYGDLQAKLWAAEALAERAAAAIEAINAHADSVTEAERGEAAVVVAAAKQRAIDTGLEIGSRVYEVTGARAGANSVERYALLGELPEPTWYT